LSDVIEGMDIPELSDDSPGVDTGCGGVNGAAVTSILKVKVFHVFLRMACKLSHVGDVGVGEVASVEG